MLALVGVWQIALEAAQLDLVNAVNGNRYIKQLSVLEGAPISPSSAILFFLYFTYA
jgi:hypothetical protein